QCSLLFSSIRQSAWWKRVWGSVVCPRALAPGIGTSAVLYSVLGTMLIYIAGLDTIPGEVYEAASIDGSSGWQSLRHITLPLVSGFIVINTILCFKNYLNAYDI